MSSPSSAAGLKCTLQTGEPPARRIEIFSTPSFWRTETHPSNWPMASSWPSEVQESEVAFAAILCFDTDFWSGDQIPKSEAVALASSSVTGLYSTHWIVSLCEYLRIPSPLLCQMMTDLSAPPDENRLPSFEYDTA